MQLQTYKVDSEMMIKAIVYGSNTIAKKLNESLMEVGGRMVSLTELPEVLCSSSKSSKEQLLQWALKGFPEQTVVSENKRINENEIVYRHKERKLKRILRIAKRPLLAYQN